MTCDHCVASVTEELDEAVVAGAVEEAGYALA